MPSESLDLRKIFHCFYESHCLVWYFGQEIGMNPLDKVEEGLCSPYWIESMYTQKHRTELSDPPSCWIAVKELNL